MVIGYRVIRDRVIGYKFSKFRIFFVPYDPLVLYSSLKRKNEFSLAVLAGSLITLKVQSKLVIRDRGIGDKTFFKGA